MSQMQEVHAQNFEGTGASVAAAAEGLFESPGALVWRRKDWAEPVGSCSVVDLTHKRTKAAGRWVSWARVSIPELTLERGAALLLLQGQSLSRVLIPNHELVAPSGTYQVAHLLLRVDPWELWRPVPRLTGLVLARLGEVPMGIPPTELLASLAADSALA